MTNPALPSDPTDATAAAPARDGLFRMATAPLALPSGMRDLLPPRAARRRALARAVLSHAERYGYQLVVPPAFEREDVVARGLGASSRRDLVRFLDPETGEVLVLRPDVTPQIARIAATRYRTAAGPLRWMYEGTVMRRPRGRARRHRQIAQAGIECIGWSSAEADAEVIVAATGALAAAGLQHCRVELGHAGIGELLLSEVREGQRDAVAEAFAARDTASLARILGADFSSRSPLAIALDLAGGPDVLHRAERAFSQAEFRAPIAALRALIARLEIAGLGDRLLVDLAEVRGIGYYTGVMFQLLAEGPGEPLGAGGRYDTLLARYGADAPATGCALDLEHVEFALERAGVASGIAPIRVVLVGDARARERHASRLRDAGLCVAEAEAMDSAAAMEFARAAGYDSALVCNEAGIFSVDPRTGELVPYALDATKG